MSDHGSFRPRTLLHLHPSNGPSTHRPRRAGIGHKCEADGLTSWSWSKTLSLAASLWVRQERTLLIWSLRIIGGLGRWCRRRAE